MKINKVVRAIKLATCLITVSSVTAVSAQWEPVTGEENLHNFMIGKTLEWEEPGSDPIIAYDWVSEEWTVPLTIPS
jgi:hypothetical protein